MEKNKYTLYTIIILLIIFIPCSIYGTYTHITTTANLKQEFKFDNKLYFYENEKLLGTYTCKKEDCDYATYSNNDMKANVINSQYTFINDNEKIYLYNITSKKSIETYDEIQNTFGSVFKVRQGNNWGAINVSNTITSLIACNYDTLEYKNNSFLVSKNDVWSIYQGNNQVFKSDLKIKDFNDDFVIVTDGKNDKLYDFENNEHIEELTDKTISIADDFFLIKQGNIYSIYYMLKLSDNYVSTNAGTFTYDGSEEIVFELTETTINFYAGEQLMESVALMRETP